MLELHYPMIQFLIMIMIMIMIIIIMMINHDFVSSFFPRVSQHVLALSSDWFIGLRPSVYDTDPLYLKGYNHF